MSQIRNPLLRKLALGPLDQPFVLGEKGENLSEMFNMFLQTVAIHQNIVEKDDDTLLEQGLEGAVHDPLERIGCSSQPERHHGEFKVAPMCLERSLVLLARC